MIKKLVCALIPAAALAACAQPTIPTASDVQPAPSTALYAPPISSGASDDIGQFIPMANQSQRVLEASAAPAH